MYFMGSETLPSACYILFDESSIPFYSTSNGYKYISIFCRNGREERMKCDPVHYRDAETLNSGLFSRIGSRKRLTLK